MKKAGWLVGALVGAVALFGAFGPVKASAEEMNLIGLSDEMYRLYVSANNELDVISQEYLGESIDKTEIFSVGEETLLLSQFVYVNLAGSTEYANVRTGPSTEYDIVGRVYGGAVATAVGESNGWTKVVSGNVEGYILSSFLLFGQDAVDAAAKRYETKARVLSTTLNLRKSGSVNSGIVHQLPGYCEVTILDKSQGSWYKVSYNNGWKTYTGYVSADYLSQGYYTAITAARVKELESNSLLDNILWPYPASYGIYSDYGYRIHPITKQYKMHTGLDIGGAYGASEVAALDGTVTSVGYDPYGGGNYVVVTTYTGGIKVDCKYLHCQNIYVRVGETVKKGQRVSSCGASGSATGPHLHFTMSINGSNVDPMDYLYKYEWCVYWGCTRNKD